MNENKTNRLFILRQKVLNITEKSLICNNRKSVRADDNKLWRNHGVTNFKYK